MMITPHTSFTKKGFKMTYFVSSIFPTRTIQIISLILLFFVLFCGCSGEELGPDSEKETKGPLKIVYVDWSSERASSNLIKAVVQEKLDRECELLSVTLHAMWESLAVGDQDGMVAAWLPLHQEYLDKYREDVENLGSNLNGTRIGLVVPEYVDINSIEELGDHPKKFNGKIVGIDPQAGIMEKTKQAMEEYQLYDFELISGSGPTMTTILEKAIQEERWVVVTGWTPHWMFARWDLKYLEDTRNAYGGKEYIGTFVREGLAEDMPEVYALLDNFKWSPEDMEQVMLYARDEDTDYYQAALRWIEENKALVNSWLD